jgi:hypothetical protein
MRRAENSPWNMAPGRKQGFVKASRKMRDVYPSNSFIVIGFGMLTCENGKAKLPDHYHAAIPTIKFDGPIRGQYFDRLFPTLIKVF